MVKYTAINFCTTMSAKAKVSGSVVAGFLSPSTSIRDGDLLVVDRFLRPADGDVIIASVEISPERSEHCEAMSLDIMGTILFQASPGLRRGIVL